MERARSSHPWIARYCIRTLQLLPSLPPRIAIRWAVSGYPYCADLEPERAAEMFVDSRRANGAAQAAGVLQRFVSGDADHDPSAGPPPGRSDAGHAAHR
jgi:hypothetical protein